MMTGPNQQQRLLELLSKLSKIKRGDPEPIQERNERISSFDFTGFEDQEHRDIVTLYNNGLIRSTSMISNPANQWSSEGIYAYVITEDGEDHLGTHGYLLQDDQSPDQPTANSVPRVFIIHGTDPNGYVSQVEKLCHQIGFEPIRMMEQANRGLGLPDKLRDNMNSADFYVAVLTADEIMTNGEQRARPNAYAEAVTAHHIRPDRLAILREDRVEIPTNLLGLAYIQLHGQWSMQLLQEFKAAGLA